jgi:predicted DNA-binding transcriptional regulator AlpA
MSIPTAPDYLSIEECCALVGGDKPISPATFYRGIKVGRFPPPEHPTPGISWRRARLIEAINTAMTGFGPLIRPVEPPPPQPTTPSSLDATQDGK